MGIDLWLRNMWESGGTGERIGLLQINRNWLEAKNFEIEFVDLRNQSRKVSRSFVVRVCFFNWRDLQMRIVFVSEEICRFCRSSGLTPVLSSSTCRLLNSCIQPSPHRVGDSWHMAADALNRCLIPGAVNRRTLPVSSLNREEEKSVHWKLFLSSLICC